MQKTLIIYAHPHKNGFCGKILSETITQLQDENAQFDVIDLYAINYDPVLKAEEHYTSGGYVVSEQNKKFQDMIMDAKNLIFIYPVWWQNMPAILKGFCDRVFTSRYAFRYEGKIPIGLLKGRKAAVIISTGAPRIITFFYTGDRAIKVLTKDLLQFCGIATRGFVVDNAHTMTHKRQQKIIQRVTQALRYLS